jgi:hypothetical protein
MQLVVMLVAMATLPAQNPPATGAPAGNQKSSAPASPALPGPMSPSQDPSVALQRMEVLHQQRLQEMEVSLAKMHTLLNDMKARMAANDSHGTPSQRDNIELWEMMLGHLDKTLAQARLAAVQRGALSGGPAAKNRGPMVYRQPSKPPVPGAPAPGATATPQPAQPHNGPQ